MFDLLHQDDSRDVIHVGGVDYQLRHRGEFLTFSPLDVVPFTVECLTLHVFTKLPLEALTRGKDQTLHESQEKLQRLKQKCRFLTIDVVIEQKTICVKIYRHISFV